MRVWTDEQKQQQREAIKRWAPWSKSTGPRTDAGKKKSSQNAYKHGARSKPWRDLWAGLYSQRLYIRWVEENLARIKAEQKARMRKKRELANELLKKARSIGDSSPPPSHFFAPNGSFPAIKGIP